MTNLSSTTQGAIAERTRLLAYAIYVVWLVAIVYPFIMRWVWNEVGFLRQMGAHDFAGSGVVHLTGGTAALMGCINVGYRCAFVSLSHQLCRLLSHRIIVVRRFVRSARQGRFEKDGKVNEIRAHSMSLYWLGSMLLWFGWFFFNGVSSGGLSAGGVEKSGRAMVNTAIGGSSGGVRRTRIGAVFVLLFSVVVLLNSWRHSWCTGRCIAYNDSTCC